MYSKDTFSDRELLERLADGDEIAFSYLFERYRDPIYSTALHVSGSAWLAEEIVQDVFLDLWLQRKLAATITYLSAYLSRMAGNKIFDALKRRQRQRQCLQFDPYDADDHTPAILLESKNYESILTRAIARLPEKQRLAYQLVKQEGMSRKAAATALGVSPETVKSNVEQSLRNIRAYCLSQIYVPVTILMAMKLL